MDPSEVSVTLEFPHEVSMSESGINLDFDQFLDNDESIEQQGPFYELQSTPISPHEGEVKNAPMSTRANLKLQLMKQQVEGETRRTQQHVPQDHEYRAPQTESIPAPNSTILSSKEVPPHVYEVKTPLLHPTKYHVRQNQVRQVEMYLHQDRSINPYTQSLPVTADVPVYDTSASAPNIGTCNSAPTNPDSPLSIGVSSTTTSVSEMDDILLSDIMNLESVDPSTLEKELSFIEPTLMSQTLPHQTHQFLDQTFMPSKTSKSATSCPAEVRSTPPGYSGGRIREDIPPPFATDDELRQWHKDRQKKDNHNAIEQRRRSVINDKIKELGLLLPKGSDVFKGNSKYYDMRQNKGTILKASVDYIRKLQRDREQLRRAEEQKRQLEATNRKMLLRIQELEMMMKQSGLQGQQGAQNTTSDFLSEMLRTTQPNLDFIKTETASPGNSPSMDGIEDAMDEGTLMGGDPMISLASPAVEQQSRRSSGAVSMEEAAEMLG